MKAGSNPDFDCTGYDSFFWSVMSLFRLVMRDFWEGLMQLVSNSLMTTRRLLPALRLSHVFLSPVPLQTLRAAGKSHLSIFLLVFFPGCFFLLGLILALVVMTRAEQEEAQGAEAIQREEEFRRIVEVLKTREEEEEQVRGFISCSSAIMRTNIF